MPDVDAIMQAAFMLEMTLDPEAATEEAPVPVPPVAVPHHQAPRPAEQKRGGRS
jgi:hypothetical protein